MTRATRSSPLRGSAGCGQIARVRAVPAHPSPTPRRRGVQPAATAHGLGQGAARFNPLQRYARRYGRVAGPRQPQVGRAPRTACGPRRRVLTVAPTHRARPGT